MKTLFSLLIIPFVLFQISCEQSTDSAGKDVYISFDVESAFQNDSVKVQVDDRVFTKSKVTTNYTVNLAWSSGLQKLDGSTHKLIFSLIDSGIEKEFNVGVTNDTSTVVMRFNRESKLVTIEQYKGLLLRD